MKALLGIAILAVAMAGCVNQAQPADTEPLEATGAGNAASGAANQAQGAANNTTQPLKPPVARMQIFDTDGALVYEANFVAENVTAPGVVRSGAAVTFLGGTSEAVERTAKVERWEWDFGDGARTTGRGVSHTYRDTGGVFKVTLRVVDSHGLADVQVVTLGVQPSRTYAEPVAGSGTLGPAAPVAPMEATLPIEVRATIDGLPVLLTGLALALASDDPAADFDLVLVDAAGNEVASTADAPPAGAGEPAPPFPGTGSFAFGEDELAPGAYTLRIILRAGANSAWSVAGEAAYRVVNPAVEAMASSH